MHKISRGEKLLVYGFFACMDLTQIILDFFGVTEIINHFLDFFIGGVLLAYGYWRRLWNGQKILILAATFVGEQIPFVNALPFWTLDIKNLYSGSQNEEETEETETHYLNKDGTRLPQRTPPLYQNRYTNEG